MKNGQWKILITGLVLVISSFYLLRFWLHNDIYRMKGNGMTPTLKPEDAVYLIRKTDIKRYDVIVFNMPKGLSCKRVIGLPFDKITIRKNKIEINGIPLVLPSPLSSCSNFLLEEKIQDIALTDDEYFVIGDNPEGSYDSRSSGPIKKNQIIGIVKNL